MTGWVQNTPRPAAAPRPAPGLPNFYVPPGAGRGEDFLGMRHRWTADAARTGGMLACVEVTVPPGAGIAPHRHRHEDQAFYVVRGAVVFEGDDVAGGAVRLEAGGFFYGPRGRAHGFSCVGPEPATLLVVFAPGTMTSAQFDDVADDARRRGTPPDAHRVDQVRRRYGIGPADDTPRGVGAAGPQGAVDP